MADPLLAPGLAVDWIQRLHKLWSSIRETRREELLEIHNTFGDPELLARLYIEPDCQHVNPADHDEEEPGRAIRQPIREWLNTFLKGEFFQRDGRNTVFLLSDAGMGKTSLLMMLKLTHLLRFWPDGLELKLLKLGPETLPALAAVREKSRTVLLLDALDEDPAAWGRIEQRLTELLQEFASFRQVLLTCRTQFFPEGDAAPIERPGKVEVGGFICNLLYLSPFSDTQVESYLRKVFPDTWRDVLARWLARSEGNPRLLRARKVIAPMRSLRMRPMLLAHIDELTQEDVESWREYPVYKALVRHWLLREERRQKGRVTEAQLWRACLTVSRFLQAEGKRLLSPADLAELFEREPAVEQIKALDVGGRSLLNRTSDGGFRFSHYSIQEFLVAHSLIAGDHPEGTGPIRATDQLISFLLSWVSEDPAERLAQIRWEALQMRGLRTRASDYFRPEALDLRSGRYEGAYLGFADLRACPLREASLRGVYLTGANLHGADLRGAKLSAAVLDAADLAEAALLRADLRHASLAGANLASAKLDHVDARAAVFRRASLQNASLCDGRFSRADFTGARLEGAATRGAGFLAARGLESELDATAGPVQPRQLHLVVPGFRTGPNGAPGTPTEPYKTSLIGWPSRGNLMAVSNADGVDVWDVRRGACIQRLERGGKRALSLAWDPEGERLAAGFGDEIVQISSYRPREPDQMLESPPKAVLVSWNPAGSRVALYSRGGTVRVWDLLRGAIVITCSIGSQVNAVAWHPDKPILAVCSSWTTFLLDLLTGASTPFGDGEMGSMEQQAIAWDPGGQRIAVGAVNVKIHAMSGKLLRVLAGHGAAITSLAWSPDGRRLASGSQDKTVRVWDVETGSPLHVLGHGSTPSDVCWRGNDSVTAVTAAGVIAFWNLVGSHSRCFLTLYCTPPVCGLKVAAEGFLDGPKAALEHVFLADGNAVYDLTDFADCHDPERMRPLVEAGLEGTPP